MIKKTILFLFLAFSCVSAIALAKSHGSRNQHDISVYDRSVNLRVYVPEVLTGYFGGVWDIAVSPRLSFGPILRIFLAGKYDGYDFGLNMNYALSGYLFQNGFILNPYVEYYNANYDQPLNQLGERPKVHSVVGGVNLLYQFIWNNGFNIMLGLGLEYAGEKIPVTSIGHGQFHGHYEVTIGYAF